MIDHEAAASLLLSHEPVPVDQVVEGTPTTAYAALGEYFGQEYGVWEMSPGAMTDVEADELFIVLSGSAVVDLVDDASTITLQPGSVGRLSSGMKTRWTVTETLRKIYITPIDE